MILKENPFYLEAGGQVSDTGSIQGEGWAVNVENVRQVADRVALFGSVREGTPPAQPEASLTVTARVSVPDRHDTERNHTATHLLHAALRGVLGEHVVQRGSLVAPDRLRFDFAHTAPMTEEEKREVESRVNQGVWADHSVRIHHLSYSEAIEKGAMALFGEKYGDEVRAVEVPGVSLELCGGTHCGHTGEIGLFKIVSETGVAAGVRRLEALTGPGAYRHFEEVEGRLNEVASALKAKPDAALGRLIQLLKEKEEVENLLTEMRKGGSGAGEEVVVERSFEGPTGTVEYKGLRLRARSANDVRDWGDGHRAGGGGRVAVVGALLPDGKVTLFAFVSDDLISHGLRADAIIREVAERVGGKGGGRPHMAQAGVPDPSGLDDALRAGADLLEGHLKDGS
jgi:alanyl-tRNA synthetase